MSITTSRIDVSVLHNLKLLLEEDVLLLLLPHTPSIDCLLTVKILHPLILDPSFA